MSTIQLREHQIKAVNQLRNGNILCGGVGSGKSRTALAYYYVKNGGVLTFERYVVDKYGKNYINDYTLMKNPKDLYIITTARKRDSLEWEGELAHFLLSTKPEHNRHYGNNIVVDSWNNIGKYSDISGAFFIFDEQRVVGKGTWVQNFLKIAKKNEWILLSGTPGDQWMDYLPVFMANGFFRNKTEFYREHCVFNSYCRNFPKLDRYINIGRLIRLRDRILVDMDFDRTTVSHHEDVWVSYDLMLYKDTIRKRWDPYNDKPIEQAAGLCYILRRIVNSDDSRQTALLELFEKHPKMIVFYNFDYELEILRSLYYGEDVEVAEWNGHKHQEIPTGKKWIYLVQYSAGAEGWNCITTDTIVFFSQNYSYKMFEQARGRIDRLNTPYTDLWYYHIKSRSGIDLAISKALKNKKKFNERKFAERWD